MSTYTLTVKVSPSQLTPLQNAGYNLCLAKNINGIYSVVWSGTTFSVLNKFEWTEEFQVFASASFQEQALVQAATNSVPIALGQTAKLTNAGVMSAATGPTTGTYFSVLNNWRWCNIGVKQKISGTYQPIFVDPNQSVTGAEDLTPQIAVIVFFSRTLRTNSMFADSRSSTCEIVYESTDPQTVMYTDTKGDGRGVWLKGDGEVLSATIPLSYSIGKGFQPLPEAYDALLIGTIMSTINQTLPNTAPVQCVMTFSDVQAAMRVFADIAERKQSGKWPSDFKKISVGTPYLPGSSAMIGVDLDTKPSGKAAEPLMEAWEAYIDSLGPFTLPPVFEWTPKNA